MSRAQQIATTVHDIIDEVTTTVEDIHRSIAELPLSCFESLKLSGEVREAQARSIGAIYTLIRRCNDRVGQAVAEILPQ